MTVDSVETAVSDLNEAGFLQESYEFEQRIYCSKESVDNSNGYWTTVASFNTSSGEYCFELGIGTYQSATIQKIGTAIELLLMKSRDENLSSTVRMLVSEA